MTTIETPNSWMGTREDYEGVRNRVVGIGRRERWNSILSLEDMAQEVCIWCWQNNRPPADWKIKMMFVDAARKIRNSWVGC